MGVDLSCVVKDAVNRLDISSYKPTDTQSAQRVAIDCDNASYEENHNRIKREAYTASKLKVEETTIQKEDVKVKSQKDLYIKSDQAVTLKSIKNSHFEFEYVKDPGYNGEWGLHTTLDLDKVKQLAAETKNLSSNIKSLSQQIQDLKSEIPNALTGIKYDLKAEADWWKGYTNTVKNNFQNTDFKEEFKYIGKTALVNAIVDTQNKYGGDISGVFVGAITSMINGTGANGIKDISWADVGKSFVNCLIKGGKSKSSAASQIIGEEASGCNCDTRERPWASENKECSDYNLQRKSGLDSFNSSRNSAVNIKSLETVDTVSISITSVKRSHNFEDIKNALKELIEKSFLDNSKNADTTKIKERLEYTNLKDPLTSLANKNFIETTATENDNSNFESETTSNVLINNVLSRVGFDKNTLDDISVRHGFKKREDDLNVVKDETFIEVLTDDNMSFNKYSDHKEVVDAIKESKDVAYKNSSDYFKTSISPGFDSQSNFYNGYKAYWDAVFKYLLTGDDDKKENGLDDSYASYNETSGANCSIKPDEYILTTLARTGDYAFNNMWEAMLIKHDKNDELKTGYDIMNNLLVTGVKRSAIDIPGNQNFIKVHLGLKDTDFNNECDIFKVNYAHITIPERKRKTITWSVNGLPVEVCASELENDNIADIEIDSDNYLAFHQAILNQTNLLDQKAKSGNLVYNGNRQQKYSLIIRFDSMMGMAYKGTEDNKVEYSNKVYVFEDILFLGTDTALSLNQTGADGYKPSYKFTFLRSYWMRLQ